MKAMAMIAVLSVACGSTAKREEERGDGRGGGGAAADPLRAKGEVHLAGIRQLTRGAGENAEAYWSSSGRELILQSSRAPYGCDQIYRVPADGSGEAALVSTGKGRTTCSYFFPGDERSSTRRPTSRATPARRRPTTRRATSGRSTTPTTSSRRSRTAPRWRS